MNSLFTENQKHSKNLSKNLFSLLAVISVIALVVTFSISNSTFDFTVKTVAFLLIIVVYVVILIGLYFRVSGEEKAEVAHAEVEQIEKTVDVNNVFSEKVEEKLLVFDEANNFFSASLRADDMFRLVASRIAEIVEYKACVLFLNEENRLKASFAYGANARLITKNRIECDEGLAGKSFISGEIERDGNLSLDRKILPEEALKGLNSAISVPLTRGEEIFGVMVFI